MKNIICTLIAALFIALPYGKTQVTIGTLNDPHGGAMLDLQSSDRGLKLPNVALTNVDTYGLADGDPATASGMIVYNSNPEILGGNGIGIYYWDGTKWLGFNTSDQAEIKEIRDCAYVKIFGNYSPNVSLNASNYIILTVKVEKKGTYNLSVTPQIENGYYFAAFGQFPSEGVYDVVLHGIGMPQREALDFLDIKAFDEILPYYTNDCTPTIEVSYSGSDPVFSLDCATIQTTNHLAVSKNSSQDEYSATISISLNVDENSIGKTYRLETTTVNGISFYASGKLTSNPQEVILRSAGTTENSGTYSYTISTNSSSGSVCSTVFTVSGPSRSIKVVTFSESGDRNMTYKSGSTMATGRKILENTKLFGPNPEDNKYIAVERIELTRESSNLDSYHSIISDADIIFVLHNTPELKTYPDATMDALASFVKDRKGVLIYCTDLNDDTEKNNAANIINRIFDSSMTKSSFQYINEGKHQPIPLLAGNPITEGRYDDLTGYPIGNDDFYNGEIYTNELPANSLVIAKAQGHVRAFMHESLGFVFWGDAGPFQGRYDGGEYSTNGYTWPSSCDANGYPIVRTTTSSHSYYGTGVYNSFAFVNTMMWAIDYVLKNK